MKKIFVATDLSPVAPHVLKHAVEVADQTGTTHLVLYHAVGIPADMPAVAYTMKPAELEEWLVRDAREKLMKLAADVPAGIETDVRVEVRKAWRGILDAAVEAEADMILLGKHGYTRMDKFLGTTARRVVENTEIPVLVVPATET